MSTTSEDSVPELVPARMLNEFTYCPRLAYLEWVQGEFTHNTDTLEGRFGHRRTDANSDAPLPAATDPGTDDSADLEPGETIHGRKVKLSAPGEGLIAVLDVLEIDGDVATPVDYKRGQCPDVAEGAFEPERVQLCAQGLILRENGFRSDRGILYFIASRRRVEIVFDDVLIARTRELLGQFREVARSQKMPLPLVDSPKCPRCSLVGICLPDETNWLRDRPDESTTEKVRRLIPAQDDATPMYVNEQGAQVGKSGERLTIKLKGELLREVRMHDVSQICLMGNVQITTQAIQEVVARDIPVCYFSMGGWFHAITNGMGHNNIELRLAQFRTACDPSKSLPIAAAMISGKIRNGRTMLRRGLDEPSELLLTQLELLAKKTATIECAASLLGVEGAAAKMYFEGFARLIKGGEEFRFEDRNRRPPRDPINALLSFLYAMLVKDWTVTLTTVGFDPLLGVYHQPRYGRPALALDMAEEFRPLIADSTALFLVNSGEINIGHFVRRAGACSLTQTGRKAVIRAYERRMETLVTHPIFGYRVSYRRILEVQARLLGRTLLGELPSYPPFMTR